MTRVSTSIAILLIGGISPLAGQGQSQVPPVFRTRADVVSVNVSVQQGKRPVEGLAASDFIIADNGVLQIVTASGMGAVPLDVTLLFSVGFLSTGNLRQYRTDVAKMAQLLDPEDRIRVLEYGRTVHQIFPLQMVGAQPIQGRLDQAFNASSAGHWGIPALHDALAAALILPPSPNRRQLVVAFSNYADMSSITSPAKLLTLAGRAEAVLYLQMFPKNSSSSSTVHQFFGSFPFSQWGLVDTRPHYEEDMARVTEATGGRAYGQGIFGRSIVDFFSNVLHEYRHSYLLQYTLTGVPPEGWHNITVKATRPGRFNVQARRGYFIDAVSP